MTDRVTFRQLATRRAWGVGLARALALSALYSPMHAALAQAPAADDPDASPVWQGLRSTLFGQRPIVAASADMLRLDAPTRAVDAAVVPIAIRSRLPQTEREFVRRLLLVIDSNPSPVGLIAQLTPEAGRVELETRVRVDAYSHVRAIAEMNDGRLFMAVRYVKASGGCSAAAAGDPQAARAHMGQMRLQADGPAVPGVPLGVQLQISHPNHSGMAMDQLTRQYTPAHFVRQIDITLAERPVLSAQVDFSLSENPFLHFFVLPARGADLVVRVADTEDRRFDTRLRLDPAAR